MKPIITLETNKGIIKVELEPTKAPITVKNFVTLASKGFYNGLIFHRVIESFMIQGGCPDGTGMSGSGENIVGEFSKNGCKTNDIVHTRGVISMARSQAMNSASSQFFIMHQNAPHLDGSYAAFGKVIEGLDVVDAIATTSVDTMDRPFDDVKIISSTVELNGYELV